MTLASAPGMETRVDVIFGSEGGGAGHRYEGHCRKMWAKASGDRRPSLPSADRGKTIGKKCPVLKMEVRFMGKGCSNSVMEVSLTGKGSAISILEVR